MWTRKFLLAFVCLSLLGCRNERDSDNLTPTAIPEDPRVVNLNPNVTVENWEYLSPRSEEAISSFPSHDPEAIEFGPKHYEAYIVWRETGFDLIWGNFFCSTQPVLNIDSLRIELWLNNGIWDDCISEQAIHAFKVEMTTNIPAEEWVYVVYPHAPPSINQQNVSNLISEGSWTISNITSNSETPPPTDLVNTEVIFTNGGVEMSGPCNQMGGFYEVDESGKVTRAEVHMTLKDCNSVDDQEVILLQYFHESNQLVFDGEQLIMQSSQGEIHFVQNSE